MQVVDTKEIRMQDVELNVGGTKFKGVWIAIVLSFASTIGGGIWTASEFFSRLERLETSVEGATSKSSSIATSFTELEKENASTLADFTTQITTLSQQLEDNNVSQLQGKLAELSTNLTAISEQQKSILNLKDRLAEIDKVVSQNNLIVESAKTSHEDFDKKLQTIQREVDDLWKGLDAVSNPLQ